MEFNSEHKVIIETLNPHEAMAFIKFLASEIIRHEDDIKLARELIEHVKNTRIIGLVPGWLQEWEKENE